MQGTDILESLEEIKEELEKLKLEVADVSQVDDICKIQNNIERLWKSQYKIDEKLQS